MSTQSLVKASPAALTETLDDIFRIGEVIAQSKMFKDAPTAAQAIVKMLAGRDLEIPPLAALRGIHVFEGKVEIGAGLLAARIKSSSRYDYKVKRADNQACVLEWFERGEKTGESSFTMDDARRAKLDGKQNWIKHPSDMLFARALTQGQRRFAPDVGIGSLYAPGEISEETIDIEAEVIETKVEPFDPLPEFAQPQTEETPEQIEAEKSALLSRIKSAFLAVGKSEADYSGWLTQFNVPDWTRGRLKSTCEQLEAKASAAQVTNAPSAKDVFEGKQEHIREAQKPDGSIKLLRKNEQGELVPQWQPPAKEAAEAKPPSPASALDKFLAMVGAHRDSGVDYKLIRSFVEGLVGEFNNWESIPMNDLARATHALKNWDGKPKEEKQTKKGRK